MEGSSWCSKLRQESLGNTLNNPSTKQLCDHKFKGSSWDFRNEHNSIRNWKDDGDLVAAGFSWPPRSYTCSFCKREFRSAQALGGHMNVHRRDRARLRLSSTTIENTTTTNNNKNNNTNNNSSSSSNNNNNNNNNNNGNGSKTNVSGGHFSMVNLNLDPPNPSLNSNPSLSTTFNIPSISTKSTQFTSMLPLICPLTANVVSGMKKTVVEDSDGLSSRVGKGCEVLKKGEKFVRLELEIGVISPSDKEDLDLELRLGYI